MEILIESNDLRVTLTTLSPLAGELVRAWAALPCRTPYERAQARAFTGDVAA